MENQVPRYLLRRLRDLFVAFPMHTQHQAKGARQVNVLREYIASEKTGPVQRMKQTIDSKFGRHIYSQCLGIVEPVFGHLCEPIGISPLTLNGKTRVNSQ